jgi:AcrR family transcriptional regulator
MAGQQAPDPASSALWFNPLGNGPGTRRALSRERVVAEALAIIAANGAQALSMRALAARLGVVPGALYRYVRNKEQLYDFVLDAVLGEADCRSDAAAPWRGQVISLAHRLRAVLESHPGTAALLKTRDPLSPTSLDLAEAFLAPLLAAGLHGREAALAFRAVYDYTLGFALADSTSPAEQRLRDTATRARLHAFFRALPADRFPALSAWGPHAWDGDRDERFAAGLETLLRGIEATRPAPGGGLAPTPGARRGTLTRSPPRRRQPSSDRPDVLGLGTLGAADGAVLDALVLGQAAVAVTLNRGMVDEDIRRRVVGGDETITLIRVEPLHCSLSHCALLPETTVRTHWRASRAARPPPSPEGQGGKAGIRCQNPQALLACTNFDYNQFHLTPSGDRNRRVEGSQPGRFVPGGMTESDWSSR